MNVYEKLAEVQFNLNAPKNRQNKFGGYSYRSCEDILEAVKPLLKKVKATIILKDSIYQIGDRYYVHAEAYFIDTESPNGDILNMVAADAYAREPEEKKAADPAQISGASSSYARKYALNALLLVDDLKDPDTDEYKIEQDAKAAKAEKAKKPAKEAPKVDASDLDKYITDEQLKTLEMLLSRAEVTPAKFCQIYNITLMSELDADKYESAREKLETAIKVKEKKGGN